MSWYLIMSKWLRAVSWSNRKVVVVASNYAYHGQRKGEANHSGQLFNQSTSTGWKSKNGQQFTLLRRITNSKVVNSDIVLPSIVSLERLSPEGLIPPCRTTVWVTHLLRNILSNYWCGMHRTCTNNPLKSDRIKWLIQREIQWEVCFLRPCSEEGSDVAEPYRLYRKYFQIATSVQWKEKSNERHGGSWV